MRLTKGAATWKRPPGNLDVLNFSTVYPSENVYDIPTITKGAIMPSHLVQWGSRTRLLDTVQGSNTAVHFFLDDYRFESLWRNPSHNLDALQHVGMVLSPDFSLFLDMPVAMQIWNTYRNRWLGCFWQSHGIQVIPTVSWSLTHDFCYVGIEPGSIVAVSTVGVMRNKTARQQFQEGFEAMVEALQPSAILSYGSLDTLVETTIPVVTFPTRWEQRKGGKQCYTI